MTIKARAPRARKPIVDKPQNALIEKQVLDAALRTDFSLFVEKAFTEVTGGEEFYHNFHIDVIADKLVKIIDGTEKRLIINLPPRYLKSMIASVAFPAFYLGHFPNKKIMCISYNQELANDLADQCLRILQSKWYKRIFPKTKLVREPISKSNIQTTSRGVRIASGVDGTLTGRGADLIIIDDPLKADEAHSPESLERINRWFSQSVSTRLNNKNEGAILIVMQRLNENDLTGSLVGDLQIDFNARARRILDKREAREKVRRENYIYPGMDLDV